MSEGGQIEAAFWQVHDSFEQGGIHPPPPPSREMPPRAARNPDFYMKSPAATNPIFSCCLNTEKAKPNKSMDQMQLVEGRQGGTHNFFAFHLK